MNALRNRSRQPPVALWPTQMHPGGSARAEEPERDQQADEVVTGFAFGLAVRDEVDGLLTCLDEFPGLVVGGLSSDLGLVVSEPGAEVAGCDLAGEETG